MATILLTGANGNVTGATIRALQGQGHKLIGLVRQLPAEQVQTRTRLRLWMIRVDLYARNFDGCMANIQRLRGGS